MRGYCCRTCFGCDAQCGACSDSPPPGAGGYTCAQQAGWGKCGEAWMRGYCCRSCAGCAAGCVDAHQGSPSAPPALTAAPTGLRSPSPSAAPTHACGDVPPPGGGYTCAQQAGWGKCGEAWMRGYCCRTCTAACPGCGSPSASAAVLTDLGVSASAGGACVDVHLKCGEWVAACASPTIGKWVQRACPRACGRCIDSEPSTTGAALLSAQLA